MDEREMFGAALEELSRMEESSFDKPFPDDELNALWAIWQAGRRTTPDREAIIEECAKVCERVAAERNIAEMRSGAELCVGAIRSLKTTPTSDKGGA